MDGVDFIADFMLVARNVDAINAVGRINHTLSAVVVGTPSTGLYHPTVYGKAMSVAAINGIERAAIEIAVSPKGGAYPTRRVAGEREERTFLVYKFSVQSVHLRIQHAALQCAGADRQFSLRGRCEAK